MLHLRPLAVALIAGALCGNAAATAQIPDEILIDGRVGILFSEPLENYLRVPGNFARLKPFLTEGRCSASWRGYRATWQVVGPKLYLAALATDPCTNPKQVPLEQIFPVTNVPVHAVWYSGSLVIPLGERQKYVHMGYDSVYERYIVLQVVNGEIAERTETSTPPR